MTAATTSTLGPSRECIVTMIRSRGSVNADELAIELRVSKQCVRKHLEVLERDGYVEHLPTRGERGRPAHVYRLTLKATDQLFPKRYDIFARSVMQQVNSIWGENGMNNVLCGCANEMISKYKPLLANLKFDARVNRLSELLDAEGYEARVEKLEDGSYLLSEWNCPLTDVARDYQQVCDRELQTYRELLGTEVSRESRIAAGASRCTYRVPRPEKA